MGKCAEEFEVGEVSVSPGRTVTETDVVQYSWISGDTNPMHTDAEYSARSPVGQRIAHGTLGMSICTGLSARMGQFDGTSIAALGVDEWQFVKPVFIGDTVYLRTTVISARVSSSKPDRGVVVRQMELLNQNWEVTQRGLMKTMVYSKAGLAAAELDNHTSDTQSDTQSVTEGAHA